MPTAAIISDIHGNLPALEAVLAEIAAERVERIVCLGDVATLGPQPHEVIARLRGLGCPVVMGNTDADLLALAREESATGGVWGSQDFDFDRWCRPAHCRRSGVPADLSANDQRVARRWDDAAVLSRLA